MRIANVCLGLAAIIYPSHSEPAPVAAKRPVVDTYHGVKVADDYRWLQNWNDPEVRAWSEQENTYARRFLEHLPGVPALRSRVTQIMEAKTIGYGGLQYRKGRIFAMKREPPKQQSFLIVLPSLEALDQARVLVDPNSLDAKGSTAIDWYVPSADGSLVAVSLSHGGTESGDVHVFDVATGKETEGVVPRVNSGTAGGDLTWMPNGSGFFYTRHPRAGERPPADLDFYQQVYFHKLGTPTASDQYEIGQDFPRVGETQLQVDDRTGYVLATVQFGDGGEFSHYLRSPSGSWKQITRFKDKIVQILFGPNDRLYLVSRAGAPRGRIESISLTDPDISHAKVVVPEGPDAIVADFQHGGAKIVPTADRLYVEYQLGGPSELRVFDLDGRLLTPPKQLPVSSVYDVVKLEGNDVLFGNTSYVAPPAFFHFHAAENRSDKTALATVSPVDFSDVEVTREFAVSKDGTKVPVNILFPKGTKRDGKNPTIAYGYGGFGISMTPGFSGVRHVLFEHGFVYAIANIRGGAEFGEAWHTAGNLTHKQNVFDDFAAAIEYLIAHHYTSPAHLAIEGGSNGGLLMGATLTQHPDLMRCVVSHVGIYDMLRTEFSSNGAFNITEYGTVNDLAQFKALYAYSPYHHVQDGTRYPSALFLTGANDPRVDAMQSRKFVARLQAANASDEPILLRTSGNTGHGLDSPLSERIAETVDVYAFIFDRLGVSAVSR
ncbi:MAG TPA: prolyl oligopeptidase family serine peptidase [Planctomycetaceae bacterium]|jgi:prolyl oligopeptidase|nr:prolyl oligopeptidase family serine peptidase [Planctomycetaceae bacterium]